MTDADVDQAVAAFNAAPLDLLVTHSCPAGIGVGMVGSPELIEHVARFVTSAGHWSGPIHDCGEGSLTQLLRRLAPPPPLWLFGHFHRLHDRTVDATRFVCVGSMDESDGMRGVRPVLFDATNRTLEIHADLCIGLSE